MPRARAGSRPRTQRLTTDPSGSLERLLDGVRPTEVRLSPDASECVVLAKASCRTAEHGYCSSLWIAATDGSRNTQLRTGAGEVAMPRWSPTGDAIAFTSDYGHPGQMAVCLWQRSRRAARPVARLAGSVEEIAWAGDGASLLALVAEAGADTAGADTGVAIGGAVGAAADPAITRPGLGWRRLHRIELSGDTRVVSPAGVNVWEFDWPGGSELVATVSAEPSEGAWFEATVVLIDVAGGELRTVVRPTWQVACPRLAGDGGRIALIEGRSSDRGFVEGDVCITDVESGSVSTLDLDASWIDWVSDDRLAFAGWRGCGSTCGYARTDGAIEREWSGDVAIAPGRAPIVSASPDGTIAAVIEGPGVPPEVRVLRSEWNAITKFARRPVRHAACLGVEWTARDGLTVEGLLLKPPHSRAGRPPLIVDVHGGPSDAWSFSYGRYGHEYLVRLGFSVLLPNPRGSYGRGAEFGWHVWGDPGGEDLWDILAGVDRVVELGAADPARLGIMGGSYGGFMAAWATTQSARFKAAVALAPVTDWRSFHYTSNIGRFDELILEGDPADLGGPHSTRSPLTAVAAAAAPTLLLHGALDRCTPPTQSEQYYNALVETGVETELVVYPREGHGLRELGHQIDMWRRVGAWFLRHLNDGAGSP